MADLGTLSARITADTSAFNVGGALGALGKLSAAAAAAGTAITAKLGVEAVQASAALGDAVRQAAAKVDRSEETLHSFREAAVEAGRASTFSATKAGEALEFLAQAGLTADQATSALPKTLQLAEAGNLQLANAADIATNVMQGFSLEVGELSRVNDVLAKTASSANTSVQGMGDALSFAAPVANSLGLSLEQTSAAIGLFADTGIKGQRAGRTLRAILQQLRDPPKKLKTEFDALGVSLRDASGDMRSLPAIIRDLQASARGGKSAIAGMSNVASTGMQALVDRGAGALRQFTGEIDRSTGSARDMARFMRQGLAAQFDILQGSVATAAATVGKQMTPVMKELVSLSKKATNQLQGSAQGASKIRDGFSELAPAMGGVTRLFGDLSGAVSSYAGFMSEASGVTAKGKRKYDILASSTESVKNKMDTLSSKLEEIPGHTRIVQTEFGNLAEKELELRNKLEQTNLELSERLRLRDKLEGATEKRKTKQIQKTKESARAIQKEIDRLGKLERRREKLRAKAGGKTEAELAAKVEARELRGAEKNEQLEKQLKKLGKVNDQILEIEKTTGGQLAMESELEKLKGQLRDLGAEKLKSLSQETEKQKTNTEGTSDAAGEAANNQQKHAQAAKQTADEVTRTRNRMSDLEALGAAFGGPLGQQAAGALPGDQLAQTGGDMQTAKKLTMQARKRTEMLRAQSKMERLRLKRKREIAKISALEISKSQKKNAKKAVRAKFAAKIANTRRDEAEQAQRAASSTEDLSRNLQRGVGSATSLAGSVGEIAGAGRQAQQSIRGMGGALQGAVSAISAGGPLGVLSGVASAAGGIASLFGGGGRGRRTPSTASADRQSRKKFADLLADRLGKVLEETFGDKRRTTIEAAGPRASRRRTRPGGMEGNKPAEVLTDAILGELDRREGVDLGN